MSNQKAPERDDLPPLPEHREEATGVADLRWHSGDPQSMKTPRSSRPSSPVPRPPSAALVAGNSELPQDVAPRGTTLKNAAFLTMKLVVSLGVLAYVLWKITQKAEWDELRARLADLDWRWIALGFLAQLAAVACTLTRWKLLLDGQEMHVPLRHLVGTLMIGRFIGTFTPSIIGLDGYRAYDIARHSRRIAPAVSVIIVEKIIGFFVLSLLVLVTLPWGMRVLPPATLATVGVLYIVPVTLCLILLIRPSLIRRFLRLFFRPATSLGRKIENATAAVTTYEAQRTKLVQALMMGFPVHLFSICIFICTGHAIGAPISVTDMLFVGPLVITVTVLPISLSGLGVREAVFVLLLPATGVSVAEAALLSFLGYLIGRVVSMFGAFFWIARRVGYKVQIIIKATDARVPAEEATPRTEPDSGTRRGTDRWASARQKT